MAKQAERVLTQKLVTGMNVNKGFTLIEILIVIVIIGITLSFALLAFGDFGESKKVLFAAEQLQSSLKLTQQQAILETSTYGLTINNKGYQILKFKDNSSWGPVSNKGIFKPFSFPTNTYIILKSSLHNTGNAPHIIINASGDITPFILTIGINQSQRIATLKSSQNGDLTLIKAKH